MIAKRIIARLDVKNDFVIKGVHLEGLRKVGKPFELASKYYNQGADELIFMDAVAALYDRNALGDIIRAACRETFIPITIGGGIRSLDDIYVALRSGADKVAINTHATKDLEFIKEAVQVFGSQAIVGSVVVLKYREQWDAYINNARECTEYTALEYAKTLEDCGVGEIMVTSIDMEGTRKGYDLEITEKISRSVSVPVIASGGAGSKEDIARLFTKTNCDAAAIASILHYENETLLEIKKYLEQNKIPVRPTR